MRKFYVLSLMAATALSVSAQAPLSAQFEKKPCTLVRDYASVLAPSRVSTKAPTADFVVSAYDSDGVYQVGVPSGIGSYSSSLAIFSGGNVAYIIPASNSTSEVPSFSWTISDLNGGNTMDLPVNDNDVAIVDLFGYYNYPIVTGRLSDGTTATYDKSIDSGNASKAAAMITLFGREFPVSMGNSGYVGGHFYINELLSSGNKSQEGKDLTGVVSMFNRTTAPMRVYGVIVPLASTIQGQTPIPAGVSMDVEIWTVDDENNLVEKLGSATGDATNLNGNASQGMWTLDVTFQAVDDFGLVSDQPVLIPAGTKFAVVLNNMDKANAAALFTQAIVEGSAYMKFGDTLEVVGYSNMPDVASVDLLISLDADMPSANWQDKTMTIPSAGGKAVAESGYEYAILYTTTLAYNENGECEYTVAAPDWVTATEPLVIEDAQGGWDTYRAYVLEFSADALPAGETSRQGVVTVTCPGGVQKSFEIGQGNWTPTSVENVETANASVAVAGDNFQLTYGDEYNAVEVYNVAGAKVASYALPQGGSFEVPAADLKGVYMVVFQGAKNTTVKVVK